MDRQVLVRNAARVSRIFNTLAIVVLVIGIVVTVVALIVGVAAATQVRDGGGFAVLAGILYGVVALIYTVITWASVQLAALVAGYIGQRLGEGPATSTTGYPAPGYPGGSDPGGYPASPA